MAFLQQLKSDWHDLENDPPGKRFQNRYKRKHGEGGGKRKPLMLVAGVLLVAVGIFLMPAPGPGFIVVLLGGALLSEESMFVARALDRMEVWVRKLSLAQRIAIVLLAAALVAAAGWLGYVTFID
jgi:hypothetical protein